MLWGHGCGNGATLVMHHGDSQCQEPPRLHRGALRTRGDRGKGSNYGRKNVTTGLPTGIRLLRDPLLAK